MFLEVLNIFPVILVVGAVVACAWCFAFGFTVGGAWVGRKAEKEMREALKDAQTRETAAFDAGKEIGFLAGKPKHGADGRFTHQA